VPCPDAIGIYLRGLGLATIPANLLPADRLHSGARACWLIFVVRLVKKVLTSPEKLEDVRGTEMREMGKTSDAVDAGQAWLLSVSSYQA
jgi:hypothetical protein